MIHVYRQGTTHERDGKQFDIECINESSLALYLSDGWVQTLDEVKAKRGRKKATKDDGNPTDTEE